jgi:hypothetical protein
VAQTSKDHQIRTVYTPLLSIAIPHSTITTPLRGDHSEGGRAKNLLKDPSSVDWDNVSVRYKHLVPRLTQAAEPTLNKVEVAWLVSQEIADAIGKDISTSVDGYLHLADG